MVLGGFGVAGSDNGLDVSANVEVAFDVDLQRIAGSDEVFEDDVDYVLVKDLHVSKRVDVKLQALQLDAALVGNVSDADGGEVGKIRERADRGELRDLEIDRDLTAGELVRERVERKQIHLRARRRLNVEALLVWCW
jgi:hypothetical protein